MGNNNKFYIFQHSNLVNNISWSRLPPFELILLHLSYPNCATWLLGTIFCLWKPFNTRGVSRAKFCAIRINAFRFHSARIPPFDRIHPCYILYNTLLNN